MNTRNKAQRLGRRRKWRAAILGLAGAVLLSMFMPIRAVNAASVDAEKEVMGQAAACQPETVQRVLMTYSFERYIPLFGKRQEDRAGIATVCNVIKNVTGKGKLEARPPEDGDRWNTQVNVRFTDGSAVYLSTEGQDRLVVWLETQRWVLQDAKAYRDILNLAVAPNHFPAEQSTVRFGEPLLIAGNNDTEESGDIYMFWTTTTNNRSAQISANGVVYPSFDSVLIYKGKSTFGRYDFKIPMPAYGEGFDGKQKPILPGQGEITVSGQSWSWSTQRQFLPSATAFLSINGVPATDAAFMPIMVGNQALVPVRAIASLADSPVEWDPRTRSVLIRTKQSVVEGAADGSPQLWIDGRIASTEYHPILQDGRAYVPIRAVTAAFGLSVHWDAGTRGIDVNVTP